MWGRGPAEYFTAILQYCSTVMKRDGPSWEPAFLGFNPFSHTLARAVLVPVYEA